MKLDADALRLLSDLLDQCVDLTGPRREAWLEGLTGDAALLRPALRRTLARDEARELDDFLERQPVIAAPDAEASASDFVAGDCVGPYRLLQPSGRGGMGEVWLATRSDGQLRRNVALKLPTLSVRRSVLAQRFERERNILGALIHPHIARLYDAGVADDGQPYMALEYVEGTPITQAADERALDARGRVQLLRQVMDAVQYAHANLVIHRDLKPGNLLATAHGETKLLDFGIAKMVEDEVGASGDSELTRLGGRALTLRYAAPELINGGAISTAVDIWALGVLFYELLTGHRPFGGSSAAGIENEILTRDPELPSQRRSGAIAGLSRSLAADLDTIALKALKKNPADRYATVSAFADDLDRWLRGQPVRAQRDTPWYRARRFVGRNRLAVAAATFAGIAVVGTAAVALLFGLQAREESARALAARDFMLNVFRRADPDLSQGKEVSAKQLLGQGYRMVLETMEQQPLLQADLLAGIGNALANMDDLTATDEAYAQAALRYGRLGNLREAAALTLDRAAIRIGSAWEVPGAVRLLAQAEADYPQREEDADFVARHAILRAFAADIAGDKAARQDWYERARTHAGRALQDAGSRTVFAVRLLALMDGTFGHSPQAVDRLSALLDRLKTQTSTVPADTVSVLVDLGTAQSFAGRYRVALGHYETADALCRKWLNPNGSQCVYSQFHRSRLLVLLGMDQSAMETVPFLIPPRGPVATAWTDRQLTQAFEVLSRNGRLDDHEDVLARIVAAGSTTARQGENWQSELGALVALSKHHFRAGEFVRAAQLSSQAQALITAMGVEGNRFALAAHLLHAMTLHVLGDHEAALKLLDRVHAAEAAAWGADHPVAQWVSMTRVRPLWALQRPREALALMDRALPILREAMGPDAPTLLKLEALRGAVAGARPWSAQQRPDVELSI